MATDRSRAAQARYYARHRDELLAKKALRRAERPEEARVYRETHKAEIKASSARYYEEHRQEIRERNGAWTAADPWYGARRAHHSAMRRARHFGIEVGPLTYQDFARLQLLPCAYCGVLPARSTDHVVALSRGGPNTLANLVPACESCNKQKGAA